MTTRRRVIAACLLATPALLMLLWLAVPPFVKDFAALYLPWINYAQYDLSGVIVDDSGRPLKDVTLRISESLGTTSSFSSRGIRDWKLSTDATFAVRTGSCDGVTLTFSHPSTFPKRLEFADRSRRTRRDLRVVLKSAHRPTKLVWFTLQGDFSDTNTPEPLPDSMNLSPGEQQWESWVRSRLLMICSTNAAGKPDVVEKIGHLDALNTYKYAVPRWVRLSVRDSPDSGFVLFEPAKGTPLSQQMVEAPASGYAPLLLDHERLAAQSVGSERGVVYAYFRIEGVYGRLAVKSVEHRAEAAGRAFAHITVQLQPDSSRNLCWNDMTLGDFSAGGRTQSDGYEAVE